MSTFQSVHHSHPLRLTVNPYNHPRSIEFVCNVCRGNYDHPAAAYHCEDDHFDVCGNCVHKEKGKGNNKNPFTIQTANHSHPLVLTIAPFAYGWGCDQCGVSYDKNQSVFHCTSGCQMDLCWLCVARNVTKKTAKFVEKETDTVKTEGKKEENGKKTVQEEGGEQEEEEEEEENYVGYTSASQGVELYVTLNPYNGKNKVKKGTSEYYCSVCEAVVCHPAACMHGEGDVDLCDSCFYTDIQSQNESLIVKYSKHQHNLTFTWYGDTRRCKLCRQNENGVFSCDQSDCIYDLCMKCVAKQIDKKTITQVEAAEEEEEEAEEEAEEEETGPEPDSWPLAAGDVEKWNGYFEGSLWGRQSFSVDFIFNRNTKTVVGSGTDGGTNNEFAIKGTFQAASSSSPSAITCSTIQFRKEYTGSTPGSWVIQYKAQGSVSVEYGNHYMGTFTTPDGSMGTFKVWPQSNEAKGKQEKEAKQKKKGAQKKTEPVEQAKEEEEEEEEEESTKWPGVCVNEEWVGYYESPGVSRQLYSVGFTLKANGLLTGKGLVGYGANPPNIRIKGKYTSAAIVAESTIEFSEEYEGLNIVVQLKGQGMESEQNGKQFKGTFTTPDGIIGTWVLWPKSNEKKREEQEKGKKEQVAETAEDKAKTQREQTLHFNAPTITKLVAGPCSAVIFFTAPILPPSASPITQYCVCCESQDTAHLEYSDRSPITIRELDAGVDYTFTILATNSAGLSSASSEPSKPIKPKPMRLPTASAPFASSSSSSSSSSPANSGESSGLLPPPATPLVITATQTTTTTTTSLTIRQQPEDPIWRVGNFLIDTLNDPRISSGRSTIYNGSKANSVRKFKFKARPLELIDEAKHEEKIMVALQKNEGSKDYVVQYEESIDAFKQCYWIVMERGMDSLDAAFQDDDFYSDQRSLEALIRKLAKVVQHMHRCSIVWLDLKPANFVSFSGSHTKYKAVDFDSAREYGEAAGNDYTLQYSMPPERCLALKEKTSLTAHFSYDIFSLGLVFYRCFVKHPFWERFLSEEQAIKYWLSPDLPEIVRLAVKNNIKSSELGDLICQMLAVDPKHRPSIDGVLNHPFMADRSGRTIQNKDLKQQILKQGEEMKQAHQKVLSKIDEKAEEMKNHVDYRQRQLLENAVQAVLGDFPSCIMVLPKYMKPETKINWMKRMVDYENLLMNKSKLFLLCEWGCKHSMDVGSPYEPYWHKVDSDDGFDIQAAKPFVTQLAPFVKGTLTVLSVASRLARVVGLNFSDEIVNVADKVNNFTERIIGNTNIPECGYSDTDGTSIPARLKGEVLEYMRKTINHQDSDASMRRVGELWLTCILKDCVVGGAGKYLWLCPQHQKIIERWNDGEITTQEQLRAEGLAVVDSLQQYNPDGTKIVQPDTANGSSEPHTSTTATIEQTTTKETITTKVTVESVQARGGEGEKEKEKVSPPPPSYSAAVASTGNGNGSGGVIVVAQKGGKKEETELFGEGEAMKPSQSAPVPVPTQHQYAFPPAHVFSNQDEAKKMGVQEEEQAGGGCFGLFGKKKKKNQVVPV